MKKSAFSGFDSLYFWYHIFSFVEYDIISKALICFPIKADGISSILVCCILR